MIRIIMLCGLCLLGSMLPAQRTSPRYPQNYFRWPLSLAPEIVANLGELRDNHWHMGLDIRTNQKVNQLVYAAAEGYVAHIGIRPLSFGRFIVINHPNGLSTLYGHLNDFSPALEAYVTAQQYEKQSWPVELDIPSDKFPVSKGAFISYSGTTGGSQGPHVHFEIRDTRSGECLNPLLFGFPFKDNTPPTMVKLAYYDRMKSVYDQVPRFYPVKKSGTNYILSQGPVMKTASPRISFALQSYDRINGSLNQDGIYSAKLFLDNVLQVEFTIDSIDYNETRYMNAHVDYKYHENGGAFIQHLSQMPGDRGGVYHQSAGDGVIELEDSDEHDIRVEIADAYKNTTSLSFKVQYDESLAKPANSSAWQQPFFSPNQVNTFIKPDFEVTIPENGLYDTVRSVYFRNNSSAPFSLSAQHQLNDETIPLHTTLNVRIKPDKPIPAEWKNKLVIRRTFRDRTNSRAATFDGQWISADLGDFGFFQAFADITPPVINSPGSGDTINLSSSNRIVFTPTDNSGIKSFRAEVDDKWIRFTNDKARTWIYIFDDRVKYGVHKLTVTVEDIVGNVTEKTWWFKKYAYTPPPKKKVVKKKTTKKAAAVRKKKR